MEELTLTEAHTLPDKTGNFVLALELHSPGKPRICAHLLEPIRSNIVMPPLLLRRASVKYLGKVWSSVERARNFVPNRHVRFSC